MSTEANDSVICPECHGDGGWWYNPDWPMGDAESREWEQCPCGTDNPERKRELLIEAYRAYEIARYGHSIR